MHARDNCFQHWGFVFAMGLIISPDALVMSGQMAGRLGPLMPAGLLVAAIAHAATAAATATGQSPGRPPLLLTTGRLTLTVFAVAGALVSAGYAVNEIFIEWFPNLAAAGILLGVTVAIAAVGGRTSLFWQASMTGAWCILIAIMAMIGLSGGMDMPARALSPGLMKAVPFALLAILAGHDLAQGSGKHGDGKNSKVMVIAGTLFVGAILHALWGLAALTHVAPGLLADTTIPHLLAARAILGNTGRIIMGVIIIAGAAGVSHALINGSIRMLQQTAAARHKDPSQAQTRMWRVVGAVTSGMAVGLVMAGGLGGSSRLEDGIAAGLALLMAHYASINWQRVRMLLRRPRHNHPLTQGVVIAGHLSGVAVMASGIAAAVWAGLS